MFAVFEGKVTSSILDELTEKEGQDFFVIRCDSEVLPVYVERTEGVSQCASRDETKGRGRERERGREERT